MCFSSLVPLFYANKFFNSHKSHSQTGHTTEDFFFRLLTLLSYFSAFCTYYSALLLLKKYVLMQSDGESSSYGACVRHASHIIQAATRSVQPSKIGISFNGGKDSVVMVEALISVLGISFVSQCVLFTLEEPDEFEELVDFRTKYVKNRLPLSNFLRASASDGIRNGLWRVKHQTDIDVVFLGTRCTDPAGKHQKDPVSPTTEGWPPMTRVCPLFHWSTKDVWRYIHQNQVPWCNLYEQGYSSIGLKSSTRRNPLLMCEVSGNYKPAWLLDGDHLERHGRG